MIQYYNRKYDKQRPTKEKNHNFEVKLDEKVDFILLVVILRRISTPYVVVCPPKIEGFDRYKNGDHKRIGFHLFSKKTPI